MNKLHSITTPLKVVSHPSQIKCKVRCQKGLYTVASHIAFTKRQRDPHANNLCPFLIGFTPYLILTLIFYSYKTQNEKKAHV